MKNPETIIFVAFSIANTCRLLAYIPQISVLLKERDVTAVSSATWALFCISNGITALYAAQIVADTAMALTFTANTICCGTIVALVQHKRWRIRKAV
jgi:uncharacterized protein with PQ loop repeat